MSPVLISNLVEVTLPILLPMPLLRAEVAPGVVAALPTLGVAVAGLAAMVVVLGSWLLFLMRQLQQQCLSS
jgi:hypothetical protein